MLRGSGARRSGRCVRLRNRRSRFESRQNKIFLMEPRRRGIVVIASASRKEDPGFESRQGVRFLVFLYIICSTVVET
jgi:hypothetical protein